MEKYYDLCLDLHNHFWRTIGVKLRKTYFLKGGNDKCLNLKKKYSKLDQHLARHFKYNSGCLSIPPPFLCSQVITPFSNSMISTNKETEL